MPPTPTKKNFTFHTNRLLEQIRGVKSRLERMTPADYAAPNPLAQTLKDVENIKRRFEGAQNIFKTQVTALLNKSNFTNLTKNGSTLINKNAAKKAVKNRQGITFNNATKKYKFNSFCNA